MNSLLAQRDNRLGENAQFVPYMIHGQLYHWQGPIVLDDNNRALYIQLYIIAPQRALEIRQGNIPQTNNETMELLQNIVIQKIHLLNYMCQQIEYDKILLKSTLKVKPI